VATNHLFNAAPRDGTVVGIFAESQVINQLTGTSGVQFDFRAFNWLGSSYVDPHVCLVRSDAAMTDFRSMIGSRAAIAVGATGPGSNTYAIPRLLAVATGANFKVVSGYQTTSDVRIAVERGEVHGMCLGWESVRSASSQWLDEGYAQVLVQVGLAAHPDLPDVPVAIEFAKDTASRMLLQLVDAPGAFAKPFALPPGVDPARVHLMRRALQATYRDPAFLAEARSMKLEFQPKTAADIQRTVTDVLATPPDVAARYRQMVEP
jgi:tripartite-type tricarboxylate transporter receptor subunit TctC